MKKTILFLVILFIDSVASADSSVITISKPYFRWLFSGFGFQHPEAALTPFMTDEFRDERAVKTFREISPTFGRVYAGFSFSTKDQMDRFADYYDLTFRWAGTTLYVVPGCMPACPDELDVNAYAEKVAESLDYLIHVRHCVKIRFYCLTNELTCGDRYDWFALSDEGLKLFADYTKALRRAFRDHGLDSVAIVTTDQSTGNPKIGDEPTKLTEWALKNLDDETRLYCTHCYVINRKTSDMGLYKEYSSYFSNLVQMCLRKNKRYMLGEYGWNPGGGMQGVMGNDVSFERRKPKEAAEGVLCKCEIALAAMNAGAYSVLSWSFVDYPDPFLIEDGDTPLEHAKFESGKSVYRADFKYNKWGIFKWETTDKDYSSYAQLYAMGYLAKLFRKGSTVLPSDTGNAPDLRCGAVLNPDGSVSIAVINRGAAKEVEIRSAQRFTKPLRKYVYNSAAIPWNAFNDLQPAEGTVPPSQDGMGLKVSAAAKSITFLTTDYVDRTPPGPVATIRVLTGGGGLTWAPCQEPEHVYYRVFKDGRQIASTVATSHKLKEGETGVFQIISVDRWGNAGQLP